ncbi:MAG: RelA/SpoT domain-containing protein [Fibrobacter sp.]|nr:RelA/SpoT domain-containing protein [Fibrobacter sp.]
MIVDSILSEYDGQREAFLELQRQVSDQISDALKKDGIRVLSLSARVKDRASLHGKILRKPGKYFSLSEITDILGVRVIVFFADDIDRTGRVIEQTFNVDRENSVDKRKSIAATEFGYLSLHYICSIKPEINRELSPFKFEIQIRTGLQHIWAEIEHDIGYKSKFGIPRQIRRLFSKMASLLEIADDEFLVIRDGMDGFVSDMHKKIATGKTDAVHINSISLAEYMAKSGKVKKLLEQIANIDGAEISDISPEVYVAQLDYLGKKTLADLDKMIDNLGPLALQLAEKALKGLELDILSSNVALLFLCRAELVTGDYDRDTLTGFYMHSFKKKEHAEKQADQVLRLRETLCIK